MESGDVAIAEQLVYDYREAELSPEDRALCDYAVELTVSPNETGKGNITELQQWGFSQAEITIAVQVIGYFNYINRVADALGVDAEEWMGPSPEKWRAKKANFV